MGDIREVSPVARCMSQQSMFLLEELLREFVRRRRGAFTRSEIRSRIFAPAPPSCLRPIFEWPLLFRPIVIFVPRLRLVYRSVVHGGNVRRIFNPGVSAALSCVEGEEVEDISRKAFLESRRVPVLLLVK